MERPADVEKIQLIAVLRVLGQSQDMVANELHISKTTVANTEAWVKKQPLQTVTTIFDDQALSRVVGRELPTLEEVEPALLVRAGKVTRDDVLRHYRDDYLQNSTGIEVLYEGSKPYCGWFSDPAGQRAFYVRIAALAKGQMARFCWAKLTILSPGETLAHKVGEFELHPVGDEEAYSTPKVSAKKVDIVPGIPQYFDVAFSGVGPPVKQPLTSGYIVSVGIGFPPQPQAQPEGCWIATPIALFRPTVADQAYLPPGSYGVRVTVGDQNGPANSADFTIISPAGGQELQLQGANPARRM